MKFSPYVTRVTPQLEGRPLKRPCSALNVSFIYEKGFDKSITNAAAAVKLSKGLATIMNATNPRNTIMKAGWAKS